MESALAGAPPASEPLDAVQDAIVTEAFEAIRALEEGAARSPGRQRASAQGAEQAFEAIRSLEEGAARSPGELPSAPSSELAADRQAIGTSSILAELLSTVTVPGEEDGEEVLLRPRELPAASPLLSVELPSLGDGPAPVAPSSSTVPAGFIAEFLASSAAASVEAAAELPVLSQPLQPPSPAAASAAASSVAGALSPQQLAAGSGGGGSSSSSSKDASPQGAAAHGPTASDGVDLALQFACPICLEVCEEAVETPCCHNLFCQGCLLSEEHRIETCPICKSSLQAANVLANVPVRRMIQDMPCGCRFEGCSKQLRRRDRERHEVDCDYMPMQCRFSSRCRPLLRSQLAQHEATQCPYRPVVCPMGCGSREPFNRMQNHLDRECPRVLCRCEHCDASIHRAELEEHVRSLCPLVVVTCGQMEEGTAVRCEFRCERRLLSDHRATCAFRPVRCQHEGCAHATTARRIGAHEETCQWKRLPCPDCGLEVRLGWLQEHLDGSCPEHRVACPFSVHGCPEMVPRRLLEDHLQQACSCHLSQLCAAVASRDAELAALRAESAHMRKDFEKRLAWLERFVEPPAPPLQPRPQPFPGGPGQVAPSLPQALSLPPPPPPPPPPSVRMGGASPDLSRRPSPSVAGGPLPPPPFPPAPQEIPSVDVELPHSSMAPASTGATTRPRAAAGPAGAGSPRTGGDFFPGPAWDRDLAVSPPVAMQPMMLLREGGVSQVPILVPPSRIQTHGGASRGRLAGGTNGPGTAPMAAAAAAAGQRSPGRSNTGPQASRPIPSDLAFPFSGPLGAASVPLGSVLLGSGVRSSPRTSSPLRGDGADDLVEPGLPPGQRSSPVLSPASPRPPPVPFARLVPATNIPQVLQGASGPQPTPPPPAPPSGTLAPPLPFISLETEEPILEL